MKAIVKEDKIIHVTEKGDTEIGVLPRDVGLERLRWTGTEVVDLAGLDTIHVRALTPTFFELHAIPVPDSQPVAMRYRDRKRLIKDGGTIRLQTLEEKQHEVDAEKASVDDNRDLRAQAKEMIETWTFANVITHIDNTFSALNDAQRKSLKVLYCVVLWMAKKLIGRN